MNADGTPGETVAAGVDAHWALIEAAAPPESFPLIQRLNDYYDDASFAVDEIPILEMELRAIGPGGRHGGLVLDLMRLCSKAKELNQGIEAIAD